MPWDGVATSSRPGEVALRMSLEPVRLKGFEVDDKTTWAELAYEGEWKGHHAGEFAFSREIFETIIGNFRRQTNPVTVYYEHPTAWEEGQPIPAAGRILDLKIAPRSTGDGTVSLYGLVRFTERAAKFIRGEEYTYTSVVVRFNSTDRETGEEIGPELRELAITNDPFLDGQAPLRLTRTSKPAAVKQKPTGPRMPRPAPGTALSSRETVNLPPYGPRRS